MSILFFGKSSFLRSVYKNIYTETALRCSSKPAEIKTVPTTQDLHSNLSRRDHKPSNFDKKILVWTKRFKTAADVPETIPKETIEKAKDKARIKFANYMIVATIIGCITMAVSGKRAFQRGESVSKMNTDWHKEMNRSK